MRIIKGLTSRVATSKPAALAPERVGRVHRLVEYLLDERRFWTPVALALELLDPSNANVGLHGPG